MSRNPCNCCEQAIRLAEAIRRIAEGLEKFLTSPGLRVSVRDLELHVDLNNFGVINGPIKMAMELAEGYDYDRVVETDQEPEITCSITDEERKEFEEISRISGETAKEYQMARALNRERHLEWCFDCCWRD